MAREKVSIREIGEILGDEINPRTHQIQLRRNNGDYRVKRLHQNLVVPSFVHGYSLAIEYMKSWFLREDHFEKGYFKTVYVNGKHVLDDYKTFNKDNIKKEKPMLAIVPTVEWDHDRENLDIYMADPALFLRRSMFQQSFFKDEEREQFLGLQWQELKMNFNFRIRVSTRAQQIDLLKKMELRFRLGATQVEYLSADFHIPKDIMLKIAEKAGFDVDWENKRIPLVMEFISYMNAHSDLPILFKMRAINQKAEFFVRVRDMYTHIACLDKISPDDGEREGQLDNNFHLDFAVVMRMPIPHFYVHYAQVDATGGLTIHEEDKNTIGLYSFNDFDIPEKNELGWYQIALTSYLCDKGEKDVDLSSIFAGNTSLHAVIEHSLSHFISPKSFIDVRVFRNDDRACLVQTHMDFEKKTLCFDEDMDEETIYIVVYTDKEYLNETIISINEYNKNRIDVQ